MSLTKQQLQVLNTTNFPNNTTGYITPTLLRDFNSQSVDSMALQTQVDSLSSSFQSQLNDLEDFSSSLVTNFATVNQLNASSSTLQSNINGKATTGSVNTLSQSVYVQFSDQATVNSNTITRFNADELAFNEYTQSNNAAVAGKASLSQDNYFVGNQYVTGKITIDGNISASGDIRAVGNIYGANLTGSFVSSSTFNSFSSSVYQTDATQSTNIGSNSSSIGLLQTFSGSQYKNDSSSFDTRIIAAENTGYVTTASFNSFTASTNTFTASISTSVGLLQTFSGSQYKNDSSSFDSRIIAATGSTINTGSFATTGSNTFTGNQTITGDITASGNISSSTISGIGNVTLFSSSVDSRLLAAGGQSQIQDEGTILGNATSFNFNGAGVTASVSAGTASITIAGGGTIDTGSFITTGSINNSQTISGNLTVSRSAGSGQNAIDAQGNAYITDTLKVGSLTISGSSEDGVINMNYPSTILQSVGNITIRNYLNSPSSSYTGSITLTATSGSGITLNANGGANIKVNADIIQTGSLFVSGNIYATNLTGSAAVGGATTGSNSFTGSQTINGDIILTGSSAEIQNAKGVGFFNSLYNLDYSLSMPIQNTIGYIDELSLPHYYNGGVQPTISASAALNNRHLVKVTPQEWFNLTASVGDNHTGILSVEQSTGWADINNTFGMHGNALASGSVNYITQRGLSKSGIFKLGGSPVEPYIGQPVYVSDNGYELQAGYPSGSRVLRYGYVASFEQSDPLNMYVRQIFVDPVWEKGETVIDLNVSSSLRVTGQQTLSDVDLLNQVTLGQESGSLVLFAKGFTSSSLTHITASSAAVGNIIFKNNNNTGTTVVSGSANMFVNAAAVTTGFKRYIGGSGNIALNASNVPQISSSMTISPTMNNNYFGGNSTTLIMRGPASSSAWTISGNSILGTVSIGISDANHARGIVTGLTLTGNNVAGTLTVIANKENLSSSFSITNTNLNGNATINANSSSVAMSNNNINDSAFTLNNNFFSGSTGVGSLALNRNNIGGQSNTITIQGGLPSGTTTGTSISDNTILGGGNTLFIDVTNARVSGSSAYINAVRNIIGGHQLIVSGSSLTADVSSLGSAYFGRYNENDGIRNKTSDIVFAVGTGNSTTRKTGFLINSGSNTFIEGSLNVSGSTAMTGSVSVASTFQLLLPSGSNQQTGLATLDGGNPGAVVVSNSLATANSIIMLTKQTLTNAHMVAVSSKGSGTFTITSNGNGDTDVVAFMIINPS